MTDKSKTTKMTCPYCRLEADVEIVRYQTLAPGCVDLECTCLSCGEVWQAAEGSRGV